MKEGLIKDMNPPTIDLESDIRKIKLTTVVRNILKGKKING